MALSNLQKSIADPGDAKDFQLLVFRYGPTTVANWPTLGEGASPGTSPLETIMTRYWRHKALYDQADDILLHESDYVLGWGVTEQTIRAVKDDELKASQTLQTAAKNCLEGKQCALPAVAPDVYTTSAQLPLRSGWNAEEGEMRSAWDSLSSAVSDYNKVAAELRQRLNESGWVSDYQKNHMFHEAFSEPRNNNVIEPGLARLRQAADGFRSALVRDIVDVRLRSIQRLRCATSSLDEGCISEAEIERYRALVPSLAHGVETNFAPGNPTVLWFTGEPGLVRFQP